MISTQYKDKLPRQMAYAVGAQAISTAFAGVPQEKHFRLGFGFRNFRGAFQVQPQPRQILEVSYRFRRDDNRFFPRLSEKWLGAQWEIRVSAVRHEDAAVVRDLMHNDGLPLVRTWLLRHWSDPDVEASPASIRLFFNEAESTLISRENVRLA